MKTYRKKLDNYDAEIELLYNGGVQQYKYYCPSYHEEKVANRQVSIIKTYIGDDVYEVVGDILESQIQNSLILAEERLIEKIKRQTTKQHNITLDESLKMLGFE